MNGLKNGADYDRRAGRAVRCYTRSSKNTVHRLEGLFRQPVCGVGWHPGRLIPRVGFIVTNLPKGPDEVSDAYAYPQLTLRPEAYCKESVRSSV